MTADRNHRILPIVHIVDDEPAVCGSLCLLFKAYGLTVATYSSARDFLRRFKHNGPACLLLDVKMPEMNGLELQKKLNDMGVSIPVIIFSGYADTSMVVTAMREGAVDFVEKPFKFERLLDLVTKALEKDRLEHEWRARYAEVRRRLHNLTPRERQVLRDLMLDRQNKEVAADLHISIRTVESHRSHILHKLGLHSFSMLLRTGLRPDDLEWMQDS